MSMTDKKRKSDAAWKKANRGSITCTMYKGDVKAFKEYAAAQGRSVNELLREYVAQCIGRPLERRTENKDEEEQL